MSAPDIDLAIVGAGIAGIGLGIRLRRRGDRSFVIFERASQPGGTWRDNTYPGIACDVPSHLYSYSFRPNPAWSRFFAPGREIQNYLLTSSAEEGLEQNIRLDTEIAAARWDEQNSYWVLESTTGTVTARVLVLAAGRLSSPRYPSVPGLDTFPGPAFHSARWDHKVDLTGKRVAVVGSGASSVQIIPEVARVASHVSVLQRSAPYVIPRPDSEYTCAERTLFERDPDELARVRAALFWRAEEAYAQRAAEPQALDAARTRALDHLHAQVADPVLRAKLTPSYEIGCKRVLISNDYFPALSEPHVSLEASALAAIEGDTLVMANGSRHEADVVIFATGFHAAEQPYAETIVGRGGVTLAEHWSHGMTAFASTAVSGFPNMFVVNGPNAAVGHNSAIYMIEAQIDYILGALQYQRAEGDPVLAVTAEAERSYVDLVDGLSASTVWMTGRCDSWYLDPRSGRLTLIWPDFAFAFRERNGRFDEHAYEGVSGKIPSA
ncbi:MAG: NAD(P)/FAD-dependent oxidoreductase [Salinibacterium sp.]|nr:NAD(P)/FAD-dependent oxidoreductase [Salinibacterium sp.]